MTYARIALGLDGEAHARRALERRGYQVLACRYRTRQGEIDLVARHEGVVVFVEVKTRRGREFGDPAASVTAQKQRRVAQMAADYLARHRLERAPVRFDVVSVEASVDGPPVVTVIADAFRPGW
ncbi:MAG: YraN family protein [Vicinamibacterales bacterium]